MAKFDHGGGCACGLYKECEPGCRNYEESKVKAAQVKTTMGQFVPVKKPKVRWFLITTVLGQLRMGDQSYGTEQQALKEAKILSGRNRTILVVSGYEACDDNPKAIVNG